MKKQNLTKILYGVLVVSLLVFNLSLVAAVNAQGLSDAGTLINNANIDVGADSERELPEQVGFIINIFLGLLGLIFVILIIYGGFLYMTAAGGENVKKATKVIIQAVIGLIIIVSAYAITGFVVDQLVAGS